MKRYLTLLLIVTLLGCYFAVNAVALGSADYSCVVAGADVNLRTPDKVRYSYVVLRMSDMGEQSPVTVYAEPGVLVINSTTRANVQLYDITGRRIATYERMNGCVRVNVQPGTYIMKAQVGDHSIVRKVVVA